MNQYTPKINPDALVLGYTGVDPKVAGTMAGYQQRVTDPKLAAKPQAPARRPNPYTRNNNSK